MRTLFTLVATCALFVVTPPQNIDDPVLAAARAGVGAADLASLRSVLLTGHTRNVIGSSGRLSAERPLAIRVALPDKYLQVVRRTNVELRSGFNGNMLLNSARALAPDTTYGSSDYGPEQIGIEQARFARLMLGMFAFSVKAAPLSMKAVDATTIAVTGVGEGTTLLELDAATGAPARIRHQGD
ncbi:MAG TPA: hypothetical protein VLD59_14010, partial [Steroidobacteraceae bacterium]|nr:hypothetical protein [Steroidobacteraceae bacterium]